MASNKTVETESSVEEYLSAITDTLRRTDCAKILELLTISTGLPPRMWGTEIVGFGSYHYKYDSGHEGDAPLVAISSRSNAISLYFADDPERRERFLQKLGKHKTGKACIYVRKLQDIDENILCQMALNSIEYLKSKY